MAAELAHFRKSTLIRLINCSAWRKQILLLQWLCGWLPGTGSDLLISWCRFSLELKEWNVIDKLPLVQKPALLINGRFDVSQDFVNEPIFFGLQKVKWLTFEESSHTPFWEERDRYMDLLSKFLNL